MNSVAKTIQLTRSTCLGGGPAEVRRGWDHIKIACLHVGIGVLLLVGLVTASLRAADPKTRDITFDSIKFEMKKGDPFERKMLTAEIEKLVGTPVKIRGYILPSFQQKGIKQFVLVRDNMECCFGPGAALYDCILVEMEAGKTTSFTVRPVAVEGVFEVSEFKGPDGKHLAIYKMIGHEVK